MNLYFDDQQQAFQASINKFILDKYPIEARRRYLLAERGFSAECWHFYAEMGWLAVPFSEQNQGFGGSLADSILMMEALGRGLVAEPLIANLFMAGGLLELSANRALIDLLLPDLMEGKQQLAVAFFERETALADVALSADKSDAGYRLSGEKKMVWNGPNADTLIVAARTSGARGEADGLTLFAVKPDALGLTIDDYRLIDGQRAGDIVFDKVRVTSEAILGEVDAGHSLLNAMMAKTLVALAAEALGNMSTLLFNSLQYAKDREQFGVPISSFQALQHKMVDMYAAVEQLRSMLFRIACKANEQPLSTLWPEIHALKVLLGKAIATVSKHAVQIHGAMGITEELSVGDYIKRLLVIDGFFGNADYHLTEISRF